MVWNKTPPKMKEIKEGKEGEEEGADAEGGEGDIPEEKKEEDVQSRGRASDEEDRNSN